MFKSRATSLCKTKKADALSTAEVSDNMSVKKELRLSVGERELPTVDENGGRKDCEQRCLPGSTKCGSRWHQLMVHGFTGLSGCSFCVVTSAPRRWRKSVLSSVVSRRTKVVRGVSSGRCLEGV